MTLIEKITNLTKTTIGSIDFLNLARKKITDFTRNRTMPFEELIFFMLQSLKCSTQCALRRFFEKIGKTVSMRQQSFSEARKKINVAAFVTLFRLTVSVMTENCRKTWNDYYIYAIDGTKIALPASKELLKHYGGLGKNAKTPTAQGSILYDVLNDIVLDAKIDGLDADERALAMSHIDICNMHSGKKLVIFDRGYPSFELIEMLKKRGLYFLMRVKSKFNAEIDAQTASDGFVWLKNGKKRLLVRVIKIELDSGEIETLITNILDKRITVNDFKKLYFKRWPVETKYDVVKNKLQVENFSSRTVEGIEQDFYASMYLANVAAAAAIDAQPEIEEARKDKNNKYEYHANLNEVIGVLKDRLVLALTEDDTAKKSAIIQGIIGEITRSVVPRRPDRQVARNSFPRKAKFHHNRKANC